MQFSDFSTLDLSKIPSPSFVVDEVAVERNLKILNEVQEKSGAKILHALKAFSMHSLAPLSSRYLSGTCASGIHEASLAREFYQGENHVFSPAFSESELVELLSFADHIVFNSCEQLIRFESLCRDAQQNRPEIKYGIRINPQHSEGEHDIYDPCAPGSRLGISYKTFNSFQKNKKFQSAFSLISGFHFHTLCEQDFLPLERTLKVIEEQFSNELINLSWLNFGGGHHITREGYQVDALIECIQSVSKRYDLQVYLEPGEAVAIGTGVLVSEVLDLPDNDEMPQAILNTSATCHMPDTLEMPYRADVTDAGLPNEKNYTYRLGGMTCLAGDVMGVYSFDEPLALGQKIIFEDMAHYTMVKTTTFNGMALPTIVVWNSETNKLKVIKAFGYSDFKERLS
jgi:carboxynorspermidine decarboxylase